MIVLNKKQALAAMDARMVPVTAEHARRLQKRQQLMLRLYPVLKRAPPEERARLHHEARRYAVRQWTVNASLALVVATTVYLLRAQIFGNESEVSLSALQLLIAMAAIPAVVVWAEIRGYLRLLVGTEYNQS